MASNYFDVLIAVAGSVGVIATAYYSSKKIIQEKVNTKNAQHETTQAKAELSFQRAALSFDEFLSEWSEIYSSVNNLMKETNIDRFLLLKAWNGLHDPRWTTAFYQIRQGDQKPVAYVHYELDDDYIYRLRHIHKHHSMYFTVSDLDDCGIKRIYMSEGVKHSFWLFLDSKELVGTESKSITYCSFATHDDEGISFEDRTKAELIASRMKRLL